MAEFRRSLGLLDATMVVMGSMIGSGIFIVSADITRNVGSAGMLILVWALTGIMMISAALSYGELSGMYPKAGGLYVYLREAFGSLVAFLYGWALFTVIATGTIAAIGVAFGKFAAYIFPVLSEKNYLIGSESSAFKISAAQLTSILMIVVLTIINVRGVQNGRWVQLITTVAKIGGLVLLLFFGVTVAQDTHFWQLNWQDAWTMQSLKMNQGVLVKTPIVGTWATIAAIAMASVGSVFASFAWDNITFIAGEIKNPVRNIGLSLLIGVASVIGIYILVNLVFLRVLPLESIAFADSDRVGVEAAKSIFGNFGTTLIAILVMISTLGCNNAFILSSSRVFYTMAQDKLFFKSNAELNAAGVPEKALWYQCLWSCLLCLSGKYGDLLDYITFVVLLFYGLAVYAVFVLRRKYPNAERPYRALGYPYVPSLYLLITLFMGIPLLIYKPVYTWPGLILVLLGIPIYFLIMKSEKTT
jgi:APA family basic amino acid/polyamine antiporter